ncbi:MAG: FecR domain-containing protein [Bacteroidetes bacterium]|nr:FecR domain-containing protein [Bacteroidota bacterium]
MKIPERRVAYLLEVYTEGKATPDEEQELFNWIADENDEPFKKHIEKLVSSYHPGQSDEQTDWERLYRRIVEEKDAREEITLIKIQKINWAGWAAAIVVLLFGAGYYFFNTHLNGKHKVEPVNIAQVKKEDVAPPVAINAELTLANGKKIILDSIGNGMVAIQGSVKVMKLADGQIAYKGTSKGIEYNTLNNPRGSKVVGLTLADGSKVWLNTASSLRYPTAFTGSERIVEVTGEAYFEVAHNPAMPFVVKKDRNRVRVLGTHFNINAYDDEQSMNVTLLEGSVSVYASDNHNSKVISPGDQARMEKSGNIELIHSVNTDEVMSWKYNIFSFNGVGIEGIMRQVSRWYDVDIVFEKEVKEKFYAEVSRNTNVSTLLKMLEGTKSVQFRIEGKSIRVMPYQSGSVSN